MKNFLNQIKSSIYDPKFYKDLVHKDSSYSILYILKLWGVMSLLTALTIVVMIHQYQSNVFNNAQVDSLRGLANKYVDTYFADDLTISFNNFILTTNKTEPVIFPTPIEWFNLDADESENIPSNLLVISPNEESTYDILEKYDSLGVLSSTSVAYYNNDQNTVKISNFADVKEEVGQELKEGNFVLTKNIAKNKLNEAIDYLAYLLPFLYIIIFVVIALAMFVFMSLFEFAFALFSALVAKVVSWFTNSGGTYGEWYLKVLHADTFYILLSGTLGWFLPFSAIPLFSTLLIIIILYLNKNFSK